ncbi:MAG: hypothetical protein SF029_18095 [bacterium]|nr:hypothetical protein [bacterium]
MKNGFEAKLQKVANFLRRLADNERDPEKKQEILHYLNEVLTARYDGEERLKQAAKTWGGKYGFLPSGVIDYLDDDFDTDEQDET